jgi:peptidoglycan/xylan/chitin deacetylase (PgdA/CDA1 family)
MNLLSKSVLSAYYGLTLRARRRAAIDRAARQTEPVRVLFYHRVADRYPNVWTIRTAKFAAHIRWLRERFDLVSLAEAQSRIAAGRNRWPTACITFDDGYADNLSFAIPLLLRNKIPFTYFVSTDYVLGRKPFSHDVAAGRPLEPNTPQQLRDLAAAGVEIGAHTRSHADLGGPLSREKLVDEIVTCKHELEAAIQREVRYFAFPFGQIENLSAEAFQIAYRAGYHGVSSAYGGYNFPGDDAFHLRRFHADPQFIRFVNWLTVDPRKLRKTPQFDPGDYRAAPRRLKPAWVALPELPAMGVVSTSIERHALRRASGTCHAELG